MSPGHESLEGDSPSDGRRLPLPATMGKVGFSLLLALALGTLGTSSERQCVLSGSWRNDLGSNMTISAVNSAGVFSGLYLTAVSATDARILESPLQGSQHNGEWKMQPTFGFTVQWQFSNSTTVFVGQCFLDGTGEEILKTMWLLRGEVGSLGDDWRATRVGTNIFIRIK